jgi:hypothetical protein
MRVKFSGWRWAIVGLACDASSEAAGPPFATDDPEPVACGHWEFYVASQRSKTADGRSGL